jgi:hypothetical protein
MDFEVRIYLRAYLGRFRARSDLMGSLLEVILCGSITLAQANKTGKGRLE